MPSQSSYALEARRRDVEASLTQTAFERAAEQMSHDAKQIASSAFHLKFTGALSLADVDLLSVRRSLEYALQDIDALCRARNIDQRMAAE